MEYLPNKGYNSRPHHNSNSSVGHYSTSLQHKGDRAITKRLRLKMFSKKASVTHLHIHTQLAIPFGYITFRVKMSVSFRHLLSILRCLVIARPSSLA